MSGHGQLAGAAGLAIATTVASLSVPPPAAAQAPSLLASVGADVVPAGAERALVELYVNGRRVGDTIVLLRGDDVLVSLEDLRAGGMTRLDAVDETVGETAYVSLASRPELTHRLALDDLRLFVDAPSRLLSGSRLDLSPRAPEGMRHLSHPAMFLSYAPRLVDGRRVDGFAEAGLSVGPMLATQTMAHDPDDGPVRLLSQVTIDARQALVRTTLGDTVGSSGELGGGALLGGATVATHHALDPYLVRYPTLGFGGGVTSPSTLEVYVNDELVRRESIAPGDFEVTRLSPVVGSGSTRYVVRDALGREQRVQSRFYAASGLLAPGLHDFAYSVGFVRDGLGTESFDYGRPAFLGRHRVGLGRAVTAGTRLELDGRMASAGLHVTLAPGAGQIDLAGSASATFDGPAGAAGLAGYTWLGRRGSIGTQLRAASRRYATVSLDPDDDRHLLEHALTVGVSLAQRVSTSAHAVYAVSRDAAGVDARIGGDITAQLRQELWLRVGYTASHDDNFGWRHEVLGSLRLALPARHSFSVTGGTGTDEPDGSVQLSRSIQGRTGVGYRVGAGFGSSERADASAIARTGHGTLDADYGYRDGEHHGSVRVAASVSIVPGSGVFLHDPQDLSRAVVHLPGVPGARVYLDNQVVGRTDRRGRLFVPYLRPYEANRLRVDAEDLPMDVDVAEVEQIVAPTWRGAARVVFSTRRLRLVRATVAMGDDGLGARYGDLTVTVDGERHASPIGSSGRIELDSVPTGRHVGHVTSPGGDCRVVLEVPESEEPIVELGVLRCEPAPAPEEPPR